MLQTEVVGSLNKQNIKQSYDKEIGAEVGHRQINIRAFQGG